MTTEAVSIVSMLEELSLQLETMARDERQLDQIQAPRFNLLNQFDPGENAVTEILRDLLDPRGRHGQGGVFL